MHIVIEGCDGTGKTTLCRLLELATGWAYMAQSQGPPCGPRDLTNRVVRAVDSGILLPDLISDRWPLISDCCYTGEGSLVRISATLRLARVDRIIHCDVDDISELRIEAREGDPADAHQTALVRPQAPFILDRYRHLMHELRTLGHDVRRYRMIPR